MNKEIHGVYSLGYCLLVSGVFRSLEIGTFVAKFIFVRFCSNFLNLL